MPTDVEIKQADLCKAYVDVMRRMSDISENADPRTVAFIFGRPVPDDGSTVFTRPIMVCASLLSIDSFLPVVIRERRKHSSVKRDVERRFPFMGSGNGPIRIFWLQGGSFFFA